MTSTVDAATATLMAAKIGVIGGVGGLVIGAALERFLRYLGGVWGEPAHHEVRAEYGDNWDGFKIATEPEEAAWMDYEIRLDLYNGREVPVGLRDVRVVFKGSDGSLSTVPNDKADLVRRPMDGPPEPQMYGPLYVVNLPPRQWVVKKITGRLADPDEIRRAFWWRQIEFTGVRRRMWPLKPKKHSWVVASRNFA